METCLTVLSPFQDLKHILRELLVCCYELSETDCVSNLDDCSGDHDKLLKPMLLHSPIMLISAGSR